MRSEPCFSILRNLGLLWIFGFGGGGVTTGLLLGNMWLAVFLGAVGFSTGWFIMMSRWKHQTFITCFSEHIGIPITFTAFLLLKTIYHGYGDEHLYNLNVWAPVIWTIYLVITSLSAWASMRGDRIERRFYQPPSVHSFFHH